MQLSGPLGGMGLVLPLTSVDAAYLATWQATGPRVKAVCTALGRPVEQQCDQSHYEAALTRLTSAGIAVNASGDVSFTDAARSAFEAGPWKDDVTVKELTEFMTGLKND